MFLKIMKHLYSINNDNDNNSVHNESVHSESNDNDSIYNDSIHNDDDEPLDVELLMISNIWNNSNNNKNLLI